MHILRSAVAGTLESSDAYVRIAPYDGQGIELEIESVVLAQYGPAIRRCVLETLAALGISSCRVAIQDRGALDCVLEARVEAAALRAAAPREEEKP